MDETVIMTLRHGETDFNRQKRYAGLLDVPLSEKGIEDCSFVSRVLVQLPDIVITSDLRRAIETAHIIVDGRVQIVESEALSGTKLRSHAGAHVQ